MRKILILFFLAIIFKCYTQQAKITQTTPQTNIQLPNVIAPTPESSFRTDFGNLPMNEYKGKQNFSLPIYNISYGEINYPILLNYAQLGVKVNDIPNDVGVSWILETGGVVNRIINDIADEKASSRVYFNDSGSLLSIDQTNGSSGATQLNSYVTNSTIDTEVDIFSFVFPGCSGSFYLNLEKKVVFINNKYNCKVESFLDDVSPYNFIITSQEGVRYFFGGDNATEETFARPSAGEDSQQTGKTSFYLSKIIDRSGNTINFDYSALAPISIKESIFQKQFMLKVEGDPVCDIFSNPNTMTEKIMYLRIKSPKILNKIYYDDVQYVFERVTGFQNAVSKLNKIKVYKNNSLKEELVFSYLDKIHNNELQRFFLDKIERFNYNSSSIATKNNEFKFEYYDPLNVPQRLSFNIDYLGFYNGTNNSSLIPNTKLFNNAIYLPLQNATISGTADRRPDFNYTRQGSLKSIIYPTKGKTMFEYEAIPSKVLRKVSKDLSVSNQIIPAKYNDYIIIDKDSITGDKIKLSYALSTLGNLNTVQTFRIIDINIYDNTTNVLKASYKRQLVRGQGAKTEDFIIDREQNVSYRIELILDSRCDDAMGDLGVQYENGYKKEDDLGIRLMKQYDYTEENVNIKRIYYTNMTDLNNVNLLKGKTRPNFNEIIYDNKTGVASICNSNSGGDPGSSTAPFSAVFYYLNSVANHQIIDMSSVESTTADNQKYKHVTISFGGDHFEKGGEEKEFSETETKGFNLLLTASDFYYSSALNTQMVVDNIIEKLNQKKETLHETGGNLLISKVFDKQFLVKTKIENTYFNKESKIIYNIVGTKLFDKIFFSPGVDPGSTTTNLIMGYYPTTSYTNFLMKSVNKEYIQDIDIRVSDDNNIKKIVTTQIYEYENPVDKLSKKTVIFPDGIVNEINYLYAHEKNNQKLINANMIGFPLETTVIKKENTTASAKTLSKTETKYDNPAHLFPTSVLSYDFQTDNPSTEVTYDKYDSKGNLQQYTGKDGVSTVIIWGYNKTQPIAKIEGAKLTDIQQSLIDAIVNASNTDSLAGANNDETTLLSALNSFRNSLSAYQITTYTYDPLIGVRSITAPSGIRESYLYDSANRLEKVIDVNGKVLKEFKYNYKN